MEKDQDTVDEKAAEIMFWGVVVRRYIKNKYRLNAIIDYKDSVFTIKVCIDGKYITFYTNWNEWPLDEKVASQLQLLGMAHGKHTGSES